MKKNIFALAAAAVLAIGMTACEPEVIVPGDNPTTPNTNARVKSTADLHNTDWTYTVTFGLNFDGTYAHFTFPENVIAFGGDEGVLEQIQGVSYEYSYDGTTHTGYLDGVADDEDDNPGQLQFTYDDATDVITFVLNMFYPEDGTPVTLTLNFERAE